jgi:hypothetical protein
MRLVEADGGISYECSRRWPAPRAATSQVSIRIGASLGVGDLAERDHFLTARWILFSASGSRRGFARASHAPWPLRRAEVLKADDGLLTAAGLPPAEGRPLAHYSPGVDVRIGRPERYRPGLS